jgi:hypothetical protein
MFPNFAFLIEILGTISFAMSGSFAAMQKRFDPFGVIIIAFVTSVGGGTVRDLLLESSTVKEDNSDTVLIKLNGTKLTYIYHLISNVKVKGLGDPDSETFAQVLIKIADMSKILNYYDIKLKDYSSHIMDWVSSFQDSVTYELKPE